MEFFIILQQCAVFMCAKLYAIVPYFYILSNQPNRKYKVNLKFGALVPNLNIYVRIMSSASNHDRDFSMQFSVVL